MTPSKADLAAKRRTYQVLLFLFSVAFFGVVAHGYFYLFIGAGFAFFLALVFSALLAVIAWWLARVIGTHGGIRRNFILFIPLFLLSAAGVYNWLMLNIEGRQIVTDAASESQERFGQLQLLAERRLAETGVTGRSNRVRSNAEALYSEIRNPANCGQGPEARRLVEALRRDLPGFTPLSAMGRDCSRNEEIIADYRERIDPLVARAEWNNPELQTVAQRAGASRNALEGLRSGAGLNYSPASLPGTVNSLEEHNGSYRNLRLALSRHAEVRDIAPELPLAEVRGLGNTARILDLVIGRYDELVTYVYLFISFLFDYLIIHAFKLVSEVKIRRREQSTSLAGAM
ncbi:MAG TPA: hypothetical protein VEZ41_03050 [Allosphingosinicella sp.]|jgi:hypothetical protein|nr:hypothetical protein [Allosphingosinicella sp.]